MTRRTSATKNPSSSDATEEQTAWTAVYTTNSSREDIVRFMYVLFWSAVNLLLIAALFMVTWNYALPRLIESADINYKRADSFTDINYATALVTVLLLSFMIRNR